jgi:hypothetical protein
MAAQAWKVYNLAKKKIGNGTLSLASTTFRLALVQSSSNFATYTLGTWGSITNEVASVANSYSSSGRALDAEVWTVGASAKQYKFDANDVVFTASGADITNIKGAVIWLEGASAAARHLLCFASLTSTQFTLASGNTLTIQMNTAGIITLA